MNSPRAKITIINGQGLARPPLKRWEFQPEIAYCNVWADRGAR